MFFTGGETSETPTNHEEKSLLPWKCVWQVRNLPWKLDGIFGSRNYFQSDLLRLWSRLESLRLRVFRSLQNTSRLKDFRRLPLRHTRTLGESLLQCLRKVFWSVCGIQKKSSEVFERHFSLFVPSDFVCLSDIGACVCWCVCVCVCVVSWVGGFVWLCVYVCVCAWVDFVSLPLWDSERLSLLKFFFWDVCESSSHFVWIYVSFYVNMGFFQCECWSLFVWGDYFYSKDFLWDTNSLSSVPSLSPVIYFLFFGHTCSLYFIPSLSCLRQYVICNIHIYIYIYICIYTHSKRHM